MDTESKKVVINLVLGIQELIAQSKIEIALQRQAEAVLNFYIINPALTRDPYFFDGAGIGSNHESTAPPEWTPFLIHLLKTGYELFKMELERLPELEALGMLGEIPTPQELINRFVSALAGFYGSDHTNYHEMCSKLPLGIINGVTHETSESQAIQPESNPTEPTE